MQLGIGLGVTRLGRSGSPLSRLLSQLLSGASQLIAHPLEYGSMFQDRAGTTPVTEPGQLVGRVLDAGPGGYHATAISDAARGTFREAIVRGLDLTPDYWIDATNGNDANAGTSEGAAWQTFSAVTSAILSAGQTTTVRVKSGLYDDANDSLVINNGPTGCSLVVVCEPGVIMDGTAGSAIANTLPVYVGDNGECNFTLFGNGLIIRDYNYVVGGASPNGIGYGGAGIVVNVYDVTIDGCVDGISGHVNAHGNFYDCTVINSIKAIVANVSGSTMDAYRCNFTGTGTETATLMTDNAGYGLQRFYNCIITGGANPSKNFQMNNVQFYNCQIGSLTQSINLVLDPFATVTFEVYDSYINLRGEAFPGMVFDTCFGKLSARVRNFSGTFAIRNCVLTAPASGLSNILYSNFDNGGSATMVVENNIFETATAAAFMSVDATNAAYVVAAGSEFFNNILSGSAAFDADLIAADTGGSVIVDNITADALIGAANTLNPNDYGYTAGSPAIGSATDGGNCGFAVGGVAAPVTLGTGRPVLPYIEYNGVNTAYATPALPAPLVDKAQVFAGVRKLSDAAAALLVELSTSTGSNNGTFYMGAPGSNGQPGYAFASKGTIQSTSFVSTDYAAPITNGFTGLGDISGDLATLRIDGTQVDQKTSDQGTGNYNPSGTYPLYYGARGGTSLFLNGNHYATLGPITRFSAANATAGQIAAAEAYYTRNVV